MLLKKPLKYGMVINQSAKNPQTSAKNPENPIKTSAKNPENPIKTSVEKPIKTSAEKPEKPEKSIENYKVFNNSKSEVLILSKILFIFSLVSLNDNLFEGSECIFSNKI